MRRKIILLSLALVIILFACSPKDSEDIDEISQKVEFELVKTQMVKSFQRLDPFVEVRNKEFNLDDEDLELTVSLGLMESSGLKIKNIDRYNEKLNIYVESEFNEDKLELAIPQAIIKLDDKEIKDNINALELNIINDEEPIKIKVSLNDAISKINSHFKLSPSITPTVDLIKKDEEYIWDIRYKYIFDKEKKELPLIAFNSQVNANTCDILNYDKEVISEPIDSGSILNYSDKNMMIYKKDYIDKKTEYKKEELWIYNLKDKGRNNLFTSDGNIISTQISPDFENISFIESFDENNNMFLINKKDKNAFKISFEENINPDIINWIDNENVCIVEKLEDKSILYKYNIENDTLETLNTIPLNIHGLIFNKDRLVFTENQGDSINKQIYLSDLRGQNHLIGEGFQPRFISDNIIVYLEDIEGTDANTLHFYDLESKEEMKKISDNIQGFQIIENGKMIYISKKEEHKNYNIYSYDLLKDDLKLLTKSLSNKVIYSLDKNMLYVNINSPVEEDINKLIYPIDL